MCFIERTACSDADAKTDGNQTHSHGLIWFFSELMFLVSRASFLPFDTLAFHPAVVQMFIFYVEKE